MSDLQTGGINFNNNDPIEDIKLNVIKKVIPATITIHKSENDFINYFDFLKKIASKELDTKDLNVIDEDDHKWYFNEEANSFLNDDNDYLSDYYNDIDLVNLKLKIIPKEENTQFSSSEARNKVIKYLENQYMDLDMEIDNCQGCMDGLDEAFEELAIYKDLLSKFGISVEKERERLTNEWYAKRIEEEKQKESKKKAVFDHIKFNWDLLLSKDPSKEILFDIVLKINQLLDYLQENE